MIAMKYQRIHCQMIFCEIESIIKVAECHQDILWNNNICNLSIKIDFIEKWISRIKVAKCK